MILSKYFLLLLIAISIIVLPQCRYVPSKSRVDNQTITIWIHGTRMTPTALAPRFFYHKLGYTPAYLIDHQYQWHTIADTLIQADPQRFSWESFYFFGWSGKLCPHERMHASQNLYNHIIDSIAQYQKIHNKTPRIRLITHSHGGNVALNLATINYNNKLKIDELILLACPVQTYTEELTSNSTFKRIYSLYSRFDSFQVMDMQGFHKDENGKRFKRPLLSSRTFKPQPHMAQVQLSWKRRGLMHVEFITAKFLKHLPWVLDTVDGWMNASLPHVSKKPWSLRITRK